MSTTTVNPQGIRFLYNELRFPKPNVTVQEVGTAVARTFDALTQAVNGNSTVINNIINTGGGTPLPSVGFWTLTGNLLYPTTLTNVVLVGISSTDLVPTNGSLIVLGTIAIISASISASTFTIHASGSAYQIISSSTGSGAILPIAFFIGGTEIARFRLGGTFLLGFTSTDVIDALGKVIASNTVQVINAATNASSIYLSILTGTSVNVVSDRTGTGTFLPMAFVTNGATRMTLDNNGALLVGFTSSVESATGRVIVSDRFVASNDPTNPSSFRFGVTLGEAFIQSGTSGTGTLLPIHFYMSGQVRQTIDVNGAVLVNLLSSDDTAPGRLIAADKCEVVTAVANASTIFINITAGVTTNLQSSFTGTGTCLPLAFFTCSNEWMRLLTNGRLLVGRTTEDGTGSNLQVNGNISANGVVLGGTTGGFWTRVAPNLYPTTSTDDVLVGFTTAAESGPGRVIVSDRFISQSSATNPSSMRIGMAAGEAFIQSGTSGTGTLQPIHIYMSGTVRLAIDTSGLTLVNRIASGGIGAQLQVSGNVEANALNNAFGFDGTTAQATGAALLVYQGFQIHSTGSPNISFLAMQCDTSSNLSQITSSHLGTGANLPLVFNMGASEAMRIDLNRALLVGLTSSDLSTSGSVIANVQVAVASATTNASSLRMVFTGGQLFLQSIASGTGTLLPIQFVMGSSEAMRIDTGRTLLVGFTSHDFGATAGRVIVSSLVGVFSAATNSSGIWMSVSPGTETSLLSQNSGTGTDLPLSFYTGGSRRASILVNGHFLVNNFTDDGTGATLQVTGNISLNGALLTFGSGAWTQGTGVIYPTTITNAVLAGLTSSDDAVAGRFITNDRFVCVSAATNASLINMGMTAGTETFIANNVTGTGTQLPMSFFTNTNRRMVIDTGGTVMIGGFVASSAFGSQVNRLVVFFDIFVASDPTNANFIRIVNDGGNSVADIIIGTTGTAAAYTGGLRIIHGGTEVCRFIAASGGGAPGNAIKHTMTTVAQLPAGQDGMRAFVSDATSGTFGSLAVGGSTVHVPVFFSSTGGGGGGGWFIG